MTTTSMTPKELADHLASIGFDAFTENHAAGPGGPHLPTVKLPDGTYVIVSNQEDTAQDGVPLGPSLHAQRYGTDENGWINHGDVRDIVDGDLDTIAAAIAGWKGGAAPAGTARVNVVTGTLSVDVPGATDVDIYPHNGTNLGTYDQILPWGEDEEDMTRADAALAALGWKRTGPWQDAPGGYQAAPVTPGETMTVTEYAVANDLDPASMITVIDADSDVPGPVGADPAGRRIDTRTASYEDGLYPVGYLALVARSCREQA